MDFDDPIRLRCIVPLRKPKRQLRRELPPSAEEVTGLSRETLKRRYPHLIVDLSARREGMSLGNALAIAAGKATTA
jgi:hypothetical protein